MYYVICYIALFVCQICFSLGSAMKSAIKLTQMTGDQRLDGPKRKVGVGKIKDFRVVGSIPAWVINIF